MDDVNKDVHTEHCCAQHGCKYADPDCPVASGNKPQSYPCESCEWEKEDAARHNAEKDNEIDALRTRLEDTVRDYTNKIEALRAKASEHRDGRLAALERAERLAEEIDWIKSQPDDDRMFAEIEAAAKASFQRHRTSCRGQVLTRADNHESHLVWATLEWSKRTNGAEQRAERLADALRHQRWCRTCGEDGWGACDEGRAAIDLLRDHAKQPAAEAQSPT